ncbi:MAG: ATP-binding cassette domain-containing protein [Alphaproteobacteria bacterium]|nr:ATP-binding cassette domain-containing protein [Alphaproteobacteria bacterium]
MTADLLALAGRAQRRTTVAAIFAGIAAALAGVALVAISGWFLTGAALAGAGGFAAVQAFNYLLPSAGIRGFAIVRTLARYFERLLGHRAALLTLADLRPRLFARLAGAEIAEIAARGGGTIAAHLGSDVEALEDLAIRRISITAAAAGALSGLGAALLAGPAAAAILALGLAVTLLATRFLAPRLLARPYREHGEALQALKALYVEYAGCSVELALYGQANRASAILADHARQLDRARLAIIRREGLFHGLLLTVAAFAIAGMLAVTGAALPVQALAALAGAGAFEAWSGLTHSLLQRARITAALRRIAALASLPPRAAMPAAPQANPPPALTLRADGAALTVAPGGRIRLAGPSGSGKTRMLENLVGLRRDAPERTWLGETDTTALGIDALRQAFAVSAQDAPLLAGTLADNLRLAKPGLTEAEMWAALEVACLADTVRAMPGGLDTWLGAEGARLSGGQRKRLSLARALLAGKAWLVLDEPSEGLDAATERRLADNLDGWLRETGTGLVLVNHRPGLDRLADRTLSL